MRRIIALVLTVLALVNLADVARAIEPVPVPLDVKAIDLTSRTEFYATQGDRIQISTAPDADGITRRIEVSARDAGTTPSWIVFALANQTNEQIERLIVVPHFRLAGSGVISPDLGASRIAGITASQGFPPDREDGPDADIFRLTLDPGTIVTYVAELRTASFSKIYLWEPDAYKDRVANFTLYKGIIIGIAGLLALFLSIVFVVRGAVIFPAAAALAWAVLAYVCIDFGFWNKLFGAAGESDRIWRAIAEAVLSATLLVFLFAYLNLNRWHVRLSHMTIAWFLFIVALIGLAVYDAPMAAGVARISLASIAIFGFILVIYLAVVAGYDRAVMLIPTWLLLVLWIGAAAMTVTGNLSGELVQPALIGGLVLIVLLIGFTVMQNAFATGGLVHGAMSDLDRRALALMGSGDQVFDWDVTTDRIYVSPDVELSLGLKRGTLEGPASSWFDVLHSYDVDAYRACLDTVIEQRRGRIALDFRLKTSDGHYHWYTLKARPVVGPTGDVIRVIGTLTDVTGQKTAEERLLHDAVHDNLTGLPNREIFFDRLESAIAQFNANAAPRPVVMTVDIDRFRHVNEAVGMAAGDSILLTIARRLSRLMHPSDTLARMSSDQFAIILMSEQDNDAIISAADQVRRTLSTPVSLNDREIALTGSVGIALYDQQLHARRDDMVKDADIATTFAKRLGGNRIEFFRPGMRQQRSDRLTLEGDLRRALERNEMRIVYQPIVRLEDRTIAGFEALIRWDHPRLGRLSPMDFIPIAEETGIIVDLGIFVIEQAARELAAWQHALDVYPPIFCSVNVSSRQLLRHDLLNDVKAAVTRSGVQKGTLKLELTESLVMENPEFSAQILQKIREIGAGLSLDDFGTGYSSLSYLQRFPFDTIKIDRSLVKQDGKGARPVILRSIIAMAHDLGMDVVAEGAETEGDTVELYQLGCEYAQGFAFGQPISALEARRIMGSSETAAA